jgi:hypothetical protein
MALGGVRLRTIEYDLPLVLSDLIRILLEVLRRAYEASDETRWAFSYWE